MRAEELPGWLAAMGVDDATLAGVRVGEEAERSWCVRPVEEDAVQDDTVLDDEVLDDAAQDEPGRADPDHSAGWEVFWTEQGGRYEWVRFADEATACFALFGRLVWAHAVRVDAAREHEARTRRP